MNRNIKDLISKLTLEEKAGLCSGADFWHLKGVERLGIPSIMVADGPHGLRKQPEDADHLGLTKSVPATCFPSGATLACSWDRELVTEVGKALGVECQTEKISVLLGPAANIKRSPLCGRNFEYLSEDPLLTGEIASAYIAGVQSQGVGTSMKHYAVNNQEYRRLSVSSEVDERTLREIYLAGFETAVKKTQPWTIMCSYNKVNEEYASQHKYLLTDILKEEWGHEGFVMSDWGAVSDRVAGVAAGMELEMPGSAGINDKLIVAAVKNGTLDKKLLDECVERILKVVFKAADNARPDTTFNKAAHHAFARKVAGECVVLLKNEDSILPLKRTGKIAIIGKFAETPRYQGGGSSHINPTQVDKPINEITKASGDEVVGYAPGFDLDNDTISEKMLKTAVDLASAADVAVIFAGLPDSYESEGYDRTHLNLPPNQNAIIKAITAVQKNIVVVLSNGSPVAMPWIRDVKGVIDGYLGGQAGGGAISDVLFGDTNPSGKLAETFPLKLTDNPSYINFQGVNDRVTYAEGIFVGYRYYEKVEREVLFPFGYGLSYSTFEYTDMKVDKQEINDRETVKVTIKVKNTGSVKGKEIVQLYVKAPGVVAIMPEKELKGFEKVELAPGEEKTVEIVLGKRAFAYYNTEVKDWHVEGGVYRLLAGSSSSHIALIQTVKVNSTMSIKRELTMDSTMGDLLAYPYGTKLAEKLMGIFKQPQEERSESKKSDGLNIDRMMYDFAIRSMIYFSYGSVSYKEVESELSKINKNI